MKGFTALFTKTVVKQFKKMNVFVKILVLLGALGMAVFLVTILYFSRIYPSEIVVEPGLKPELQLQASFPTVTVQSSILVPKINFLPSDTLYQGEAFRVELENFSEMPSALYFRGKEYSIFFYKDKPTAVIPLDIDEELGKAEIRIGDKIFSVSILSGIFQVEEIAPPKPLSPQQLARRAEEKKAIIAAYEVVTPKPYFNSPFIPPLDKLFETSPFGIKRMAKETGRRLSFHNGIDFRAAVGTPVKATNEGIVELAENYLFEGGFVILNHGMGINSTYLHLSRIYVQKGDYVTKGQIIGLSGNTGWSTGPHLHFTIKINGIAVDPNRFLNLW